MSCARRRKRRRSEVDSVRDVYVCVHGRSTEVEGAPGRTSASTRAGYACVTPMSESVEVLFNLLFMEGKGRAPIMSGRTLDDRLIGGIRASSCVVGGRYGAFRVVVRAVNVEKGSRRGRCGLRSNELTVNVGIRHGGRCGACRSICATDAYQVGQAYGGGIETLISGFACAVT